MAAWFATAGASAIRDELCDEVQGYLIGHPLPIDDYAAITGQLGLRHPERLRAGEKIRNAACP